MSIHHRLMYARQSPKRGELKQNKKESWKKRLLASSQKRHEQDKHMDGSLEKERRDKYSDPKTKLISRIITWRGTILPTLCMCEK